MKSIPKKQFEYQQRVKWVYLHGMQSQRRKVVKFGSITASGFLSCMVLIDGNKRNRRIPVEQLEAV
jgi:hypothetical protein